MQNLEHGQQYKNIKIKIMGSLSNLYISQSYQSLIHLGTNNTASANLIELQDGLGNSIGVAVNTNGDLYLSGSLTASLQQGYLYVGNASGKTTAFATSSLVTNINTGSLVTTSSFNSYTQSTNIRLNNLEINSSSVNISISNLNSTTASQGVSITNLNSATQSLFTSASLALVTASFNNGTRNLTFTKGDTSTFSVNIPDVSGSSGNFATTGSNTFNGNQTINGNVNITGSLTASGLFYPTSDGTSGQFIITNGAGALTFDDVHVLLEDVRYGESITLGDPLYVSGSNGTRPVVYKADASNSAKMPVIYVANSTAVANTNTTALTLGLITGVTTTGYPAGTTIYVAEGTAGWSASRPSGSASIVQSLGIVTKEGPGGSGRGLVLNPGPATLPNLQTGYAWVGNGANQPVAVLTSSFSGGGTTDTGSFATTGSNTFIGDQNITGSLSVFLAKASSKEFRVKWGNGSSASIFTEESGGPNQTLNINSASLYLNRGGLFLDSGSIINSGNTIQFNAFPSASFQLRTQNGGTAEIRANTDYTDNNRPYAYVRANSTGDIQLVGNGGAISLTGSTGVSMQGFTYPTTDGTNGQVLTTNGSKVLTFTTPAATINTGSFATTGSNSFIGNQIITGQLYVSSSSTTDLIVNGQMMISSSTSGSANAARLDVSGAAALFGGSRTARVFVRPQDIQLVRGGYNTTIAANSYALYASSSIGYFGVQSSTEAQAYVSAQNPSTLAITQISLTATPTLGALQDWDDLAGTPSTFMQIGYNDGVSAPPIPQFTRGLGVTGSVSISNVMNLKAQNPLPTGNVGDLAVSGSNLFFYNGAWTQVI